MAVQLVCSNETLELVKLKTVLYKSKKLKRYSEFVAIALKKWKNNKEKYKVCEHGRDGERGVIHLEHAEREEIREASKEAGASMYKFMYMIVSQYKEEEEK